MLSMPLLLSAPPENVLRVVPDSVIVPALLMPPAVPVVMVPWYCLQEG
jgi:hypothetical protein